MTTFINGIKEVKKINKETKFIKTIMDDGSTDKAGLQPKDFDYVELIRRGNENYDFDLFVAYSNIDKIIYEAWYLGQAGDEFE